MMLLRSAGLWIAVVATAVMLYSPAANACRIGQSDLLFQSVPAEIYDADFVAESVIVERFASDDPAAGIVAFEVVRSETHPELEGEIVIGLFDIDSCGPAATLNTRGFLIGKLVTDRATADFEVRLFKHYLGRMITDDGSKPLIMNESEAANFG